MDKTILVSIIARNGLDTAQLVFVVKAAELTNKAEGESDPVKRRKLLADAKRLTKLVNALKAAEIGLAEYMNAEAKG